MVSLKMRILDGFVYGGGVGSWKMARGCCANLTKRLVSVESCL